MSGLKYLICTVYGWSGERDEASNDQKGSGSENGWKGSRVFADDTVWGSDPSEKFSRLVMEFESHGFTSILDLISYSLII